MSVIVILIIASVLVAGGFLGAFLWAVKSGQFEDRYTPSIRILFDEKNNLPNDGYDKNENKKKRSTN